MSCDSCLVLKVGCVGHCESIALPGLKADMTGEHVLEFDFLESVFTQKGLGIDGMPFLFVNGFNESYNTHFRIYRPDGTIYTFVDDDDQEYCEFVMKSRLKREVPKHEFELIFSGCPTECEAEVQAIINNC